MFDPTLLHHGCHGLEKLDFVYFVFNPRPWNCFRSFARCLIEGDGEFVFFFFWFRRGNAVRTCSHKLAVRYIFRLENTYYAFPMHFKSNAQNDGFRPLLQTPCFPLRPQQSTRDAQEFGALRSHAAKRIPTGCWKVGNLAILSITQTILPEKNILGDFQKLGHLQ